MKTEENEGGGDTVILVEGDNLDDVPDTHRSLVSESIRVAFEDPVIYFVQLADRCRFGPMAFWLRSLVGSSDWELQLHLGYEDTSDAGFYWHSDSVRPAMVGLPFDSDLNEYPTTLQDYYSLVDSVDWMGFGCSGGLLGRHGHQSLAAYDFDFHGDDFPFEESWEWGHSPDGDMLVYSDGDRGGWLNHASHQLHALGTIRETIDWVFSELLANRTPEWNSAWSRD